jgi:hypothetical protein
MNEESNDIRDLTIEAKWETDLERQKRSIEKLGSYGITAMPSLEEIMTVTSREEIRQFCIDAIKGIQAIQDPEADDGNKPKEINSKNSSHRRKKKSTQKKKSSKKKSVRST